MTIIFIENLLGSGQIVTVTETFKKQTVECDLRPGENGRFFTSPFKSIVVNECLIPSRPSEDRHDPPMADGPYVPIKLTMHGNDA